MADCYPYPHPQLPDTTPDAFARKAWLFTHNVHPDLIEQMTVRRECSTKFCVTSEHLRLDDQTPHLGSACKIWAGETFANGVAKMRHEGKDRATNRVAYYAAAGIEVGGLAVEPICENKLCTNAEHQRLSELTLHYIGSPQARQTIAARGPAAAIPEHPEKVEGGWLCVNPACDNVFAHRHMSKTKWCADCRASRKGKRTANTGVDWWVQIGHAEYVSDSIKIAQQLLR